MGRAPLRSRATGPARWRFDWYLQRASGGAPPAYINLEPTNRCNLSCKWCVSSGAREGGLLDLAIADGIIQQAVESGVGEVRFFLAGEPLLHPRIGELVARASSRGLRSVIHTNAMLLTADRSRALIEAGLGEISLSINGIDEATVREAQKGADLANMAEHVRGFLAARRAAGRNTPRVILQIIQSPLEMATPLPLHRLHMLFGSPGPDRVLRLAPHGWGGQLDSSDVVIRGTRYHACQPLWQGMSVGWDGRVFLCCADLNGTQPVGDLTRRRARRLVATNQRADLPLCASCDAVWWKSHPLVHDIRRGFWRLMGAPARRVRLRTGKR
ncbi:MAG: radical SAM protein [Candidatus Eisenbacteria bacterium]|nr:radical SAM protein [Candidatus Eisenbacteria bacterium]